MMKPEQAFLIEEAIKKNISLGFFEYGTHTEMDLVFFDAYTAVRGLRIILEEFEAELRETAEELKRNKGGENIG